MNYKKIKVTHEKQKVSNSNGLGLHLKFPSTTYYLSFICQQTVHGDITILDRAKGQLPVKPQELVHQCKWEEEISAIHIQLRLHLEVEL